MVFDQSNSNSLVLAQIKYPCSSSFVLCLSKFVAIIMNEVKSLQNKKKEITVYNTNNLISYILKTN